MQVKSTRKFVRTTPDKVRVLSYMLKGKNYPMAMAQLEYSPKYAAKPLIALLKQAKDQVKDQIVDENTLMIKEIRVDEGPKLKRRRILHRGRSTTVLKRMSHITLVMTDEQNKEKKVEKVKEDKKGVK